MLILFTLSTLVLVFPTNAGLFDIFRNIVEGNVEEIAPKPTCTEVCTTAVNVLLENAKDVSELFNKFPDPKDQANEICTHINIQSELDSYKISTEMCVDHVLNYIGFPNFKDFIIKKAEGGDVNATYVCEEAHLCLQWNHYETHKTPLEKSAERKEETWYKRDFLLARNKDIYVVYRYKTNTEIQVLSAASNYQTVSDVIVTPLHYTNEWWDFAIAPNNDIFCICKTGCSGGSKMTELFILSAESNYENFTTTKRIVTGQPQTWGRPNGLNYAYQVSANRDLFVIKKVGDGDPKMTEVIVLSAASNYQNISLNTETAIHYTGNAFQLFIHPITSDLIAVKKLCDDCTNTTELHIMLKIKNYQQFFNQTGTALPKVDYLLFMLAGVDEDWNVYGLDMAGGKENKTELYILRAD